MLSPIILDGPTTLETHFKPNDTSGVCSFSSICAKFFSEHQILWSLCSVDFHTLTLQLPIQTLHSVAPELQVFVSSLENCQNFSKTSTSLVYSVPSISISHFAGETVSFDNTRVLHGRKGFTISGSNETVRWLESTFVDNDEINSKRRILKHKLGVDRFE